MTIDELRVVIINDDPDDRALLQRLLNDDTHRRYEIILAANVEEGIRLCTVPDGQRPVDCVIVDLHLASTNGLDVIERLKDEEGEVRLPIVLFIDSGNECRAASEALHRGAQEYIAKSWMTTDGLSCAIEHAIERFEVLTRLRTKHESLDRREREFKNLVEHLPDVIARFDSSMRHTYINNAVERMSGQKPEHYLGKTMREADEPDRLCDFYETLLAEVFAEGRELTFEFDYKTPAGKKCFQTRFVPEFSRKGVVDSVLGVTVDVDAGKQVEAALRTTREHLRDVIDRLVAFVGVTTPDGILVEANRLLLDSAALKAEDVLEKPIEETYWWSYSPEVQKQLRQALECAAQGQSVRYDVSIRVAPDHFITIDLLLAPLLDAERNVTHIIASGVDITERLRSEKAAKEIAARERVRSAELKTVLRATPAAIWIAKTNDCRKIIGNPASYKLLGLPERTNVSATAPDVTEKERPFQEVRDGIPVPAHQLPMQLAAKHGVDIQNTELCFRFPDGRERHVYGNAVPLRTSSGRVYGAISAFIDITKLKQAEESARVNRERFELARRAVSGVIYDWDPTTDRVEWSEGLLALAGFHPDEAEPNRAWWLNLIHPEDREKTQARLNEILAVQGSLQEIEYRIEHRNGGYRHVWDRARIVYDETGRATRIVGYTIDITERVQSEIALRENEMKFRKFATSDIIGIVFGDVDGGLDYVNNEFLRIIGYTREQMESENPLWTTLTPENWTEADQHAIAEAKLRGSCTPYEKEYLRKDGSRVPVLVGFTFFSESNHDFVAFILDTTERKRAELAQKEADTRKDEFLAMLAHELRNPLAAIRTAIQILRLKGPSNPDVIWSRDVIDRQAKHLTRLIEDLLDLSRIQTGKIQLRKVALDVRQVLTRAAESAQPLMNAKEHQLVVELPTDPLPTTADPVRLEQIVGNLLTNAAKYTDETGQITLSGALEGDHVVVRVRDNGIGISPEMLSQIFGLFAQVQTSLDRSQGGLGIGLTLVKMLVEQHGGSIHAASPGQGLGSEFTIRLPALKVEQPSHPNGHTPHLESDLSPKKSGQRILVVDDNVDMAKGMAVLIADSGHDVKLAFDGQEALSVAREFRPSFVLADIGLPGMNGYELAEAFRQEIAFEATVLIAISGYGQYQDRQRALAAGFDHHLIKPFEIEALLPLLAAPPRKPHKNTEELN